MIEKILSDWRAERNTCPAGDVLHVDAQYAERAGLPVLAELLRLAARLDDARGPLSASEVLSELRPILMLARGEAQRRAQRAGRPIEIPGVPAIPTAPIFEQVLAGQGAIPESLP